MPCDGVAKGGLYVQETIANKKGLSRCRRCRSTDVFSTMAQIRSADEGMTIFHNCNQCKYIWKEQ